MCTVLCSIATARKKCFFLLLIIHRLGWPPITLKKSFAFNSLACATLFEFILRTYLQTFLKVSCQRSAYLAFEKHHRDPKNFPRVIVSQTCYIIFLGGGAGTATAYNTQSLYHKAYIMIFKLQDIFTLGGDKIFELGISRKFFYFSAHSDMYSVSL